MVCDVNKIKCVVFCQGLFVVNEKFDDVIFLDECLVQFMLNKIILYCLVGILCQIIFKLKYFLKVYVWGVILKRGLLLFFIFEGIMDVKFFIENIFGNVFLLFI